MKVRKEDALAVMRKPRAVDQEEDVFTGHV